MADDKRFFNLSPGMPSAKAVRLVLSTRLEVVLHHLPLAIHSAACDPEHVHQLRVSSRRATAALRLFADCLSRKHHRAIGDSLHSIRRAAGDARDWDVFVDAIQNAPALKPASAQATRDFLLGIQTARRFDAQIQLIAVASDEAAKLKHHLTKLKSGSFGWRDDGSRSICELAGKQIATLVEAFRQAATPPPTEYGELHRLRILGKRLRYSIEVFIGCFEASLRERIYPAVEEMQEILGRITDAHIAAERFVEIRDHAKSFLPAEWPRFRTPIVQLIQAKRRIFTRERKQFLFSLTKWQLLISENPPIVLPG